MVHLDRQALARALRGSLLARVAASLVTACAAATPPPSEPVVLDAPPASVPSEGAPLAEERPLPPPAPTIVGPPLRVFHGTVTVRSTSTVALEESRLLAQAFDAEGALRRCYEADMLTGGMYASEIAFRVAFAWDGSVLGAERDPSSPLPAGPVVDCMASALGKLVVPPHGRTGRAVLLLVLQPRS